MSGQLTIGSLCSGYGGLDLAVEEFFGARTAWFSEFDAAPSKVLAAHWPDVPNHGDMTAIDWAAVEPVDIICGGTPCQDLSAAGRRRGMTEGTRSNLWVQMREAIAVIRPSIVVWENVRGAYSARAVSDVESEPGLLGGSFGPDRPALRALGRVLGDLSDLGYDAEWVGLRASDAGAPHARFRVFVVAYDRASEDARRLLGGTRGDAAPGKESGGRASADVGGSGGARAAAPLNLLGTPRAGQMGESAVMVAKGAPDHRLENQAQLFPTLRASDGEKGGPNQRGSKGDLTINSAVQLLPTVTTQDGANTAGPSTFGRNTLPLNAEVTLLPTPVANDSGNSPEAHLRKKPGRTQVTSLQVMAEHLLPTPQAHDAQGGKTPEQVAAMRARGHGVANLNETPFLPIAPSGSVAEYERLWQSLDDQSPYWVTDAGVDYWPAIACWSRVMGRRAPSPTIPDGRDGRHRLNARFTEWMMGQSDGWITDPTIGLTRNEALKACGNGVVTQQAQLALGVAWPRVVEAIGAAA